VIDEVVVVVRSGLLEHPLLEWVEKDLVGAGVLGRCGAVDEGLVRRRADVDLVQLELVEGALAALDHRRHADRLPDHRLDPLHAVQAEVRLDPCKTNQLRSIYIHTYVCMCVYARARMIY
jgi:hypothetical protein